MCVKLPNKHIKLISRIKGLARAGPSSFQRKRKLLILDSGQGPP